MTATHVHGVENFTNFLGAERVQSGWGSFMLDISQWNDENQAVAARSVVIENALNDEDRDELLAMLGLAPVEELVEV